MAEEKIGDITRFFDKPPVAEILLQTTLTVGDTVHIKGTSTDLVLAVRSLQIDRQAVDSAECGAAVGLPVPAPVRAGDEVFVLIDE